MLTRTIGAGDRAQAARVWQAVEEQTASPWISCSWAWTETWLRHYGAVVPHRFVAGVVDGLDVAVALVTESSDRYPRLLGARYAHVGTAGEPRGEGVFVERNRLLVGPEHRGEFAAALLAHLQHDARWDRLLIPGLDPVDGEAFRQARHDVKLEHRDCPVADLGAGADGDPIGLLASRSRRRVRRALDGLAPLTTEWAQTREHAQEIMGELVELHQRRWEAAGEPGKFASPRFAGFHSELIDRLEPESGVMLVRVRREEETVGCVYGFIEDGEVLFYQSGLRRYEDNKLNAGLAVHMCAMRACAARGLRTYDFLAPATRYKLDLSTRSRSLVWASLDRDRPRTRLDHRLRDARDRIAARRSPSATSPAPARVGPPVS